MSRRSSPLSFPVVGKDNRRGDVRRAVLSAVVLLAAPALATEPRAGGEVNVDSRYVWRGIALSEGAVVQPSGWIEAEGWTFSGWGNAGLKDPGAGRFDEAEWGLRRSWERGRFRAEPAVLFYSYPNRTDIRDTVEVYLKLSGRAGVLEFFTAHDADVSEYAGIYFGEAGAALERPLSEGLAAEAVATVGWGSPDFNEFYFGPSSWEWNFAALELALSWKRGRFSARPHAAYSRVLGSRLRALADDAFFTAGGSAGFSF